MNRNYLDLVILAILIVFGVYELYKGVRQYMDHNKEKNECLQTHKGEYTFYEEYKLWFSIYLIVSVGSLIASVYSMMINKDYSYCIAFLVLSACTFGFALDCLVKRRAWFYEDGFFYEKKFYRYKSVAAVRPKKSFAKGYDVTFIKDPAMVMTKKMGEYLDDRIKENRKKKKHNK